MKNIVEAPPDGLGGPRWIATLNTGQYIVGRPSWMTSGPSIALPSAHKTDWQRLKDRLEENRHERITGLTLYVPPYGRFEAPKNLAGYGYYEAVALGQKRDAKKTLRTGIEALAICYPEGKKVKIVKVFANGTLEHWVRSKWLPCMIGEQVKDEDIKDEGDKVDA